LRAHDAIQARATAWDQDAADNCDDFVVEFEAWLSVFHGQRDDRGEDCVDAGRRMDFRFSSDSEIDGDEAEVAVDVKVDGYADFALECRDEEAEDEDADRKFVVTLKKVDGRWLVDEAEEDY
jgi:hypothetical protein